MHKVVFKIALNMVEEFDGKKGDEKYEEDFSNSILESFKMKRVPGGPVMIYSTTASSLNIIRTSSRS